MKKFLLVLVGLFAFPNSICALTCIADCTLMEGTETGTYCACGGWVDFGSRYGCPRKLYNPITGTCESCNPSEYSCDLGSYNENRIVGYSAQPCSSVIEGCSQCYGTRTCSSCQSGYTLSNGKCISGSGSGSESESEGGMVSCPVGQYLSGKKCVDCSTIPVQNGTCTSCSSTGTCSAISCNSEYALSNGKCVYVGSGNPWSGESYPWVCGDGYAPINGVCEEICQYQVNLEGGVCMKYCAGTVGTTNGPLRRVCLSAKCFDGRPPQSERATYLGSDTYHHYCRPENCADSSDWGQCTSCNDGYTLTNGSCVMAAPSCTDGQYADSTGKCQSCSNISVTNGTCSACSSDGTCTNATCDKGYAYNASTSACTPVVTCKPPLKFSADYSGDCDGCCVE